MTDEDRRLIEESLPIKEISEESGREKRHISAMHIWWARRPLQAARAGIFSSLVRTKDQRELSKLLVELCKIEKTKNNAALERARKIILNNYNGSKPKVLDCFAGGGAIPLEALRLGCETYALDLNPVANVVELCTIYFPQKYSNRNVLGKENWYENRRSLEKDLEKYGNELIDSVSKELEMLFPRNAGHMPVAYFWVRSVKCPNPSCKFPIPLIKQFWLANKGQKQIAVKPFVDKKNKTIRFDIVEGKKIDFDPSKGTMKRGYASCVNCNHVVDNKYIQKAANENRIHEMPMGIVYTTDKGKMYRPFADQDFKAFEMAKRKYDELRKIKINNLLLLPDEPIEQNSIKPRTMWLYGMKKWGELFNPRQAVVLMTLVLKIIELHKKIVKEVVDKDYAKALTTYLAVLIDKHADHNSILQTWFPKNEQLAHVFKRQAFSMTWDYAEANPFSGSTGSLNGSLDDITHAIKECTLMIDNVPHVSQGTATKLPYEDKFFDAVITDPPYYEYIQYAELSDFFYVWLKRSIGNIYPELFGTMLTPKKAEIVQNPTRFDNDNEQAKQFYENEMTKAFSEINKVLKDDGILVVIFAHQSTTAWETLLNALLNSNLYVKSSWPIKTERAARERAQGTASLGSSIFIACRKRLTEEEGYFNEVKDELKEKIHSKLDEFWKQDIKGADFFISAIGPAVEVFGKYKKVKKLSGEEVSVNELLNLVIQLVAEYASKQIREADNVTKFYYLYRQAYDNNDIIYDEARKLAQAVGVEPNELHKLNLLEKKGDKARLLGPKERAKNKDLGEVSAGIRAPMIDVIHKACLLWEKNNRKALTDLIENSGYAAEMEILWNVAQAISEILPDDDKEKKLLQGLLNTKTSLPSSKFKSQTTLESYRGQ